MMESVITGKHDWCKVSIERHGEDELSPWRVTVQLTQTIPNGFKVGCGLHWYSCDDTWFAHIRDAAPQSCKDYSRAGEILTFMFRFEMWPSPEMAWRLTPVVWYSEDGSWRPDLESCIKAKNFVWCFGTPHWLM